MNKRIHGSLWLICLALCTGAHAESTLSFTTGLDYSSGKYGTANTTEIWYVPVSGRLEKGDWQFKLTLPYVRMTSPSGGVIIGYDGNGTPIRAGGGTPVAEAGPGDVVASATYGLVARSDFLLDLTAKVKFGTASVSKGLGTGEHDMGAVLDAYFPLGRSTPFFSLGYKQPGDPTGQALRNTWQAGAGLAYKASDVWSMGGMFDWRSAASAAGDSQRDLMLYAVYKAAPDWKLQAYASKGFSDASADYGLGLMVSRDY
jgi:hypothetical protein